MRVAVDINVLLDVLQRRPLFIEDSASVLDAILEGRIDGVLSSHAITTVYYIIRKVVDKREAVQVIRWLLNSFEVVASDKSALASACDIDMSDYEDAVTAAVALNARCSYIVTRNIRDYATSPVPAIEPTDLLKMLAANS